MGDATLLICILCAAAFLLLLSWRQLFGNGHPVAGPYARLPSTRLIWTVKSDGTLLLNGKSQRLYGFAYQANIVDSCTNSAACAMTPQTFTRMLPYVHQTGCNAISMYGTCYAQKDGSLAGQGCSTENCCRVKDVNPEGFFAAAQRLGIHVLITGPEHLSRVDDPQGFDSELVGAYRELAANIFPYQSCCGLSLADETNWFFNSPTPYVQKTLLHVCDAFASGGLSGQ